MPVISGTKKYVTSIPVVPQRAVYVIYLVTATSRLAKRLAPAIINVHLYEFNERYMLRHEGEPYRLPKCD
jgi:hypothetical protein